jgi:hypothetical protein
VAQTAQFSKWTNGPPKIPGTTQGTTQGITVGKGKGKTPPLQSTNGTVKEPLPPTAPKDHPRSSNQDEAATLAALKATLAYTQAKMALMQGPEDAPLLQVMQQYVSALTTKIAAMEPAPKEKPAHAQAQALQWKINKKTKNLLH